MGKMADLYQPDWDTKARKLAERGWIDEEIADFFGINTTTLRELKVEYPTFRDSLQRGKDVVDDRVEERLLARALGYEFDEEQVFCSNGEIVRATVKRLMHPDVRAATTWLSCRRPHDWRRKSAELDFKEPGETHARFSGYERARRVAYLLTPPANGDASKPH